MTYMKKIFYLITAFGLSQTASAQGLLDKVKQKVKSDSSKSVLSNVGKAVSGQKGTNLSNEDIISGLKEALSVGTKNSTLKLGAADGFFADAAVKILMPEEAKKVERTLRSMGMSKLVDRAILSMNRAAEDAASGVGDIFLDAVKNITVTDGLSILRGGDQAATHYLRNQTSKSLQEKMRPVIQTALEKANATAYWNDVFSNYNKFSREKVNPDLTAYVTDKAMDGIFYSIAQEEMKIRKDPAARVTDILKKVFQ